MGKARFGAEVVTGLVTPILLVVDLAELLPDVEWQWIAIASFVVFAFLVYWRVFELRRDLAHFHDNQQLELDIQSLRERVEKLKIRSKKPEAAVLLAVKQWTLDAEAVLGRDNLVQYFRGSTTDVFADVEKLGSRPGHFFNDVRIYMETREMRLGKILLTLPTAQSKNAILR